MAAKGSTSFVQGHCYHVHFDAKQFGRPDAKPVVAYGWVESADSERVVRSVAVQLERMVAIGGSRGNGARQRRLEGRAVSSPSC